MKLQYTEGCTAYSLTVDNAESIDMDINDFKSVIYKLIDKENDLAVLQNTFRDCIYSQGMYSCTEKPCECCGDYIETYTLEI